MTVRSREAYYFVRDIVAEGEAILSSTKKQAQTRSAKRLNVGMYYVNARWLGGMLTTKTMRRIDRFAQLRQMEENGTFDLLRRRKSSLNLEIERLEKYLGGVKNMKKLPGVIFIVDPRKERNAIAEAHKLEFR